MNKLPHKLFEKKEMKLNNKKRILKMKRVRRQFVFNIFNLIQARYFIFLLKNVHSKIFIYH